MMLRKGLIWLFAFLCLGGCKTIKQAEEMNHFTKDSVIIFHHDYVHQRDSIIVRDSIYMNYIIGKTDTLLSFRVDTLYKYVEHIQYKENASAMNKADTIYQHKTDTLFIKEKQIIEQSKKASIWQRIKYFLFDFLVALIAIIAILIVRYIRCK